MKHFLFLWISMLLLYSSGCTSGPQSDILLDQIIQSDEFLALKKETNASFQQGRDLGLAYLQLLKTYQHDTMQLKLISTEWAGVSDRIIRQKQEQSIPAVLSDGSYSEAFKKLVNTSAEASSLPEPFKDLLIKKFLTDMNNPLESADLFKALVKKYPTLNEDKALKGKVLQALTS